ncbi:glycosyltransferase family 2 protein [Vibrio alginolyticus]|uniref:glycosyltransferase family 2 protein n=1 Tax=Vibrio alginolyticus TaxID=663 RepID=UPI00215CD3A3|nr:glycosyltransferase family 2 protein [Vibrio alginolyticus]MCR9389654.1 glycosyltransferase family 2 protein [Vibrio alginolyticus]
MLDIVIILYNPELSIVYANIEKVLRCKFVSKIICVDNSSDPDFNFSKLNEKVHYIPLNDNFGIAHAQNIGIQESLVNKASKAVVLFDQDSILEESLLNSLFSDYLQLEQLFGDKLAAVGPKIIDSFSGKADLSVKDICANQAIEGKYIKKREIIASGKVINKSALADIGLMETGLFIDGVDHEWCWRANNMGYLIYMSNNSVMTHTVGDARINLKLVNLRVASPIRMYYQFRNFIVLLPRGYVPLYWKVRNIIGYFGKFFVFGFLSKDRQLRRKFMLKGLKDGLMRKMGKIGGDA